MRLRSRGGTRTIARALTVVAAVVSMTALAVAQSSTDRDALRQQVERRFEVLPLHDGVALKPRAAIRDVRSIELSGDTIAIDGSAVSGGELRTRLGAPDADLVLRLSYLDAAARRALFTASAATRDQVTQPPPPGQPPVVVSPESPAPPEPPAVPAPPSPTRRSRHTQQSDARIRFGGDVTVRPDETVSDTVVVIGGTANIEGQVRGDVVAVGGSVVLAPTADVSGDIAVIGGELHRDPAAHVGGKVSEIGTGAIRFDRGRIRGLPALWGGRLFGAGFALASTIARLAVLCLLACLTVLLGHDWVQRIGARAAAEPVKAGLVGLLAELLLFPLLIVTIIVLVVTIIGIPLLVLVPFAILAVAVVFLVGFTAVALRVGDAAYERLQWTRQNVYVTTLVGIALLVSPLLLARLLGFAGGGFVFPITGVLIAIGLLIEYAAWTVGFGAAALMRFGRQSPPTAPATVSGTTPAVPPA